MKFIARAVIALALVNGAVSTAWAQADSRPIVWTAAMAAGGPTDAAAREMAQMSNQDPLQPQDGQAFVAQLAQFSNLEQLQSANQSLQSLLLLQAGMSQTSDAALVGKQVLYTTSSLSVDQGHPADMQATLDGSATQVTAVITDSSGPSRNSSNTTVPGAIVRSFPELA